LFYINIFTYI